MSLWCGEQIVNKDELSRISSPARGFSNRFSFNADQIPGSRSAPVGRTGRGGRKTSRGITDWVTLSTLTWARMVD
jgi:hypothetical protein